MDKKIHDLAKVCLFGGILQVIMGFGFGFVNIAILVITLFAGIKTLIKNKGVDKKITRLSIAGLSLILVSILYIFLGLKGAPIDYLMYWIMGVEVGAI